MPSYPQFLLFGDSLVEFSSHIADGFSFAAALQSRYIRRLDVINRGFSGYNTSQALKILPEIVPDPASAHVKYLLILFGANDACLQSSPTNQHVPLNDFTRNIHAMLAHPTVKLHKPRILLVTPPPIDETMCEITDASKGWPLCRNVNVTKKYAQAVLHVGQLAGDSVAVVDLWGTIMDEAVKHTAFDQSSETIPGARIHESSDFLTSVLQDGLHLNAKGYAIFLRELLATLENKWPADTPETQEFVFPRWRQAPRINTSGLN